MLKWQGLISDFANTLLTLFQQNTEVLDLSTGAYSWTEISWRPSSPFILSGSR
jgi:hypothetical protein